MSCCTELAPEWAWLGVVLLGFSEALHTVKSRKEARTEEVNLTGEPPV